MFLEFKRIVKIKTKNLRTYLPFLAIFGIVFIGLISFQIWRTSQSMDPEENAETQEIMQAVEKGYEAIAYAYQTDDPSKLSEIFVDTPDYKLSQDVKKDVEEIFGPEIAKKAGYLK